MKKSMYVAILVATGLMGVGVGVAVGQRPETDINHSRHSNLADAQHHVVEAYNKVVDAQKANNDELGGHAERAIEHLDMANRELKAAAEFADHYHR
jgi:hypothetical protein